MSVWTKDDSIIMAEILWQKTFILLYFTSCFKLHWSKAKSYAYETFVQNSGMNTPSHCRGPVGQAGPQTCRIPKSVNGFFRTGSHCSDRRQVAGPLLWDVGAASLIIVVGVHDYWFAGGRGGSVIYATALEECE